MPKPKVQRQVALPLPVIADLQAVLRCIERGDEIATIPSDDGIQIGCLCGGLMEDGSGRFYFSVHLPENYPYVWDILLTHQEITTIAGGTMTAIPLWCCTDGCCGFKTYLKDVTCHWCDYGGDRTPH